MIEKRFFKQPNKLSKFKQVYTLNIIGNKIGDAGFVAVASCIDKIGQLWIGSCNDEQLSIDGVIALRNAIQNGSFRVSPVKYLVIFKVYLITVLFTCWVCYFVFTKCMKNKKKFLLFFLINCVKQM